MTSAAGRRTRSRTAPKGLLMFIVIRPGTVWE
jgi:hypothetical protein